MFRNKIVKNFITACLGLVLGLFGGRGIIFIYSELGPFVQKTLADSPLDARMESEKEALTVLPNPAQLETLIQEEAENIITDSVPSAIGPVSPLYPAVGSTSLPENAPVTLTFLARIHNIPDLTGTRDVNIWSPKSVNISEDGALAYVNSLEASQTLVYNTHTFERVGIIKHSTSDDAGKPVESAFSNDGKYLWIPYYRFASDKYGIKPSALAVVNTTTQKIIKTLPTGSVSKNIAVSPNSRYAAVTNWGENTITLFNVSDFSYKNTLVVGKKFIPPYSEKPVDRDSICGLCVRGILFTPDEKTLLVGLMGGGGIAGFDIESSTYLGVVTKSGFRPRDLVLAPDNTTLYATSYSAGTLERMNLQAIVSALRGANGKTISHPELFESTPIGSMPRTLKLTTDGRYAFIALNGPSEVAVLDTHTLTVISRIRADAYVVGLDISPDGKQLWTTSQGHPGHGGGNAVDVFKVDYK